VGWYYVSLSTGNIGYPFLMRDNVIGRSGTGKTVTILLKMLGIQHAWKQSANTGPKPRQIFVTQSPVLVKNVKKYFLKLMSSIEVTADTIEEIHRTEQDIEQEAKTPEEEEEEGLISQQYSKRWGSDLPERFSELQDGHFPLFVTYDQVWVPSV
jgi:predicted DNA-binding ArsR family transcriptional regulator